MTGIFGRPKAENTVIRSKKRRTTANVVILRFLQEEQPQAEVRQDEPNLLDLDELNLSEPSPATLGTPETAINGFGNSHPSPEGKACFLDLSLISDIIFPSSSIA